MDKIRRLFEEAAARSNCHVINLGVVIETPGSEYVLGWNGPPERAGAHRECLVGECITPDKIGNCPGVHAEVRAICNAASAGIPIRDGTLYLSEWFCCMPCAIAMIEAGISRLVLTEEINYDKDDCYHFREAADLLRRAGVSVEIRKELHPRRGRG
jgi:deoxycytidylate deaminase